MKEKMLGTVKWYKPHKGYGYIIGSDDETYFFEIMNCLDPHEEFKTGDKVRFMPNFLSMDFASEVERCE